VQLIRSYPDELLALKLIEWLNYCSGQVITAKPMRELCVSLADRYKDNSYFLSIYAFAEELCGELKKSKRIAQQAADMNPEAAWAHHALAHYFLNSGQLDEGQKQLEVFKPSWNSIMPLLRGHNLWHLALFYLANNEKEQALNLYQLEFSSENPPAYLASMDSIALLWRMELAGWSSLTSSLWRPLVKSIQCDPHYHYLPFNNLHLYYALVRAGQVDKAKEAYNFLSSYFNQGDNPEKSRWQKIGLPTIEGVIAFALGDYKSARSKLIPLLPSINACGGSDAQSELFIQTALVSASRSGKLSLAHNVFDEYLSHYRNSYLAGALFRQ
jgi:tetratricopeptide (TPR) repeat protein